MLCLADVAAADATNRVRHLILVIGDGMELEHEKAANRYLFGNDTQGLSFWNFPYTGTVATWDITTYNRHAKKAGQPLLREWDQAIAKTADYRVGFDPVRGGSLPWPLDKAGNADYLTFAATDSASAATALATGHKTDDGNIAWKTGDVESGKLPTIAELFRARTGGAIGIVSTTPFSHATTAAFVSHNRSRSNYHEIAAEIILKTKPDVVIGAGHPGWNKRYLDVEEYSLLQQGSDYLLAERTAGLDGSVILMAAAEKAVASGRKLFGLFGNGQGQFDFPIPADSPGAPSVMRGSTENPTLAAAVKAALRVISQNRNGFFLVVEQGDIDWANHANDYRSMIGGMHDLNEAVKAAEAFIEKPGDHIDWTNSMVVVTSDHGNSLMRLNPKRLLTKGKLPRQTAGPALRKRFTYPDGEFTYGSTNHTNEPVRIYAKGNGAQLFRQFEGTRYPGTVIIDNTQVFTTLMQALGLHQAPE